MTYQSLERYVIDAADYEVVLASIESWGGKVVTMESVSYEEVAVTAVWSDKHQRYSVPTSAWGESTVPEHNVFPAVEPRCPECGLVPDTSRVTCITCLTGRTEE